MNLEALIRMQIIEHICRVYAFLYHGKALSTVPNIEAATVTDKKKWSCNVVWRWYEEEHVCVTNPMEEDEEDEEDEEEPQPHLPLKRAIHLIPALVVQINIFTNP